MDTMLVAPVTWDLVLDIDNNIACAHAPYALAQDAASEMKTFEGEVYYNTEQGVPYWQQILAQLPPLSLIKNALVTAAERTPDVDSARCFIISTQNRIVTGQVQILDDSGNVAAAAFF